MKTTPIYIKSLEIENIRTFGNKVLLDFEKEDGTLPQWNLILGDNGIGKSTLLQCIAWMKPLLPKRKDEKPEDLDPAPIINDEENETLVRLVRRGIPTEKRSIIKAVFQASKKLNQKNLPKQESYCETSMTIKLDNQGELEEVKADLPLPADEAFYTSGVVIYAYSASRQLGEQNINVPDLEDSLRAFIIEKTVLYDVKEILHTIDYAALGALKKDQPKYKKYLEKVKEMLVSILPDFENVHEIEVSAPKLVNNKIKQGEVVITTKHGEKIPFDNFSLGYKTVVSWTVDLSWRMFNKYSNSPNPLAEPAIVLIDEIDLHLHPLWQRQIIDNLSKHFPNVQFIATAHSPLMVQAALNAANYAILKYHEDGVQIINEPEGVDGWRVDQILTSEFFGLKTSRGIKYEKLLIRREELAKKTKLNAEEKKELNKIIKELSELPTGESPEEIENRKIIADVVSKIKEKKIKIKL